MYCYNCGKELENGTTICPECGATQPESKKTNTADPYDYEPLNNDNPEIDSYNILCVIGMVISCVSFVFRLHGLTAVVGIIVSVLGLLDYPKKNEKGKGFAIAGIIIGAVSLLFSIIFVALIGRFLFNSALGCDFLMDSILDSL